MTAMILWFVVAMYLQQDVGLADNGDFTRSMQWITSGPVGIEPNWPDPGTEAWSKRFFNYWIPYWNLEWNTRIPTTSAILLWFPGALLNYYLYSPAILYLPSLSLFPKLLLFGALLLLLKWTRLQARHRTFFVFGLGVPLTLLVTSTEYVAYLNSFYQESASFVFLFLFLASIVVLRQRPRRLNLLLSLALLLFLTTSKASNVYWPLMLIPLVYLVWTRHRNATQHTKLMVGAASTLVLMFALASLLVIRRGSTRSYPYHSLFIGVLTFSETPSEHLRRLGIEDGMQCIGSSSFSSIGRECLARYQEQMTFRNTLKVIYREPPVLSRSLEYALDNMQDVSLDYLGKYPLGDPRTQVLPLIDGGRSDEWPLLNLWVSLKQGLFPTGYTLAVILLVFAGWFMFSLTQTSLPQDLAIVGLVSTFACGVDMTVAILGDGKQELVKHLFLSNLLFDIAAIAFLNGILVFCFERIRTKSSRADLQQEQVARALLTLG